MTKPDINQIAKLQIRAIDIIKELVPVVDELEDIVSAGNKLVGISDVGNAKIACNNALSYLKHAVYFLTWAKQDACGCALTDKEFIKYLAKSWLNSGDDCCSKCVYSSQTELCENSKNNAKLDDSICTAGLRAYAEITRSVKYGRKN